MVYSDPMDQFKAPGFSPEEKTALKYAFVFALVSAVGTKAVEFVYEEVRHALKRRREARGQKEKKDEAEKPEERHE